MSLLANHNTMLMYADVFDPSSAACILTPAVVSCDISQRDYSTEERLVVSVCGQPH